MKKSLFLFCLLPLSFGFFNNNPNNFNNKKFNLDSASYKIEKNFNTSLEINTLGSFHSYDTSTGWNVLISGSDLQDSVSKYKHFVIEDEVRFYFDYTSPNPEVVYNNNQFETSNYLINDKATSIEFYLDGHDVAGYYQAKITYNFKLENNFLLFKVDNYVYAGWCISQGNMYSDSTIKSNALVTFF